MIQVDITASIRRDFGKGAMRNLRREGQTPAVLYGPKADPLALSMGTKEITKTLLKIHGQNAVVALEIKGEKSKKKRHVMIKEVQKDPIRDTLIHTDFYEISLKEPASWPVELKFIGTPKGVEMGGVSHVVMRTVLVKGLPLEIPDFIEADVTALELDGPGLACKDLVVPENVTLLEEADRVCMTVVQPSREPVAEEEGVEGVEEEATPEGGEAAPEVTPSADAET